MDKNSTAGKPKPVILTCAQPTGKLTLGNFLGAVRTWSKMLDDYECYFGIVDLHALTVAPKPSVLRQNVYACIAQYLACGLDPKKCHQFVQSHVVGHTELAWILTCMTPIGELQRMTQFKDKASKLGFKVSNNKEPEDAKFTHDGVRAQASINTGLLCYPALMAADILLYNADLVPVGEDQRQHLELCRDLACRFNQKFSETFKVPEPYVPQTGARIMSLADPSRKMSKSDENERATLYVLDDPEMIKKKVGSAVTDSESEIRTGSDKPGVTNLLTIHSSLSNQSMSSLEDHFTGKGYGELKNEVIELLVETLRPVRTSYDSLIKDRGYLDEVLKEGAQAAQKKAFKILSKVQRKIGLPERIK